MERGVFPWTNTWKKLYCFRRRRRQQKSTETGLAKETSSNMAFRSTKIFSAVHVLVLFLLVVSSVCPVHSGETGWNLRSTNQTLRPEEEVRKLNIIKARLKKINKPAVRTIKSPDGDFIDCVVSHKQPAFDHHLLKGQKPLDPPEGPKGHIPSGTAEESFQLWSVSGESCPEGTVPIRRTTEKDVLRASSAQSFGRKTRRDSSSNGHEHAVGYVTGDDYYGAKASINVWSPRVVNQNEFSLSQMWVIAGRFGDDLNTIEAGWQALF